LHTNKDRQTDYSTKYRQTAVQSTDRLQCEVQTDYSTEYRQTAVQSTDRLQCEVQTDYSTEYRQSAVQSTDRLQCEVQTDYSMEYRQTAVQSTDRLQYRVQTDFSTEYRPMPGGVDEIEAAVDTPVSNVPSIEPTLVLKILLILCVNVLHDRLVAGHMRHRATSLLTYFANQNDSKTEPDFPLG